MTIVGKILVFMNLIFSLVVGSFALVDYSSRTHWAKGFRDLEGKFKIISASAEAFKRESDDLRKEKTDLYDKLVAERVVIDPAAKDDRDSGFRIATSALNALRERTKSIDELKNQMESLRKQLTEEKAKATTLANMEQGFKTDAERRQADSKVLRESLKVEMDKNFKLEQDKNSYRDLKVAAEIERDTLKNRNAALEQQIQDLARNLAQAKSNLGAVGAGKGANPPPENIEGQVTRADGNLVSISVGSDNGLSRNQTMEVFRLGQNPRYLGRIRLVEVTPTKAVGQLVGRPSQPIQTGDRVASRIVTGN